ncbi:GGDEF domain-containing protein [Roseicyclus marinus]|uniref:GGDEF domain-containing protein n=1 Tax=Roseicyclus marinus TaxID=2161673 RepID=UPI00240F1AA1|nr:GGDEF domain-containing protein [Roseicyclus marinus]MDG3039802.1 GGDEF domain-containing protein [Roseicyclus marinus]
MIIGFIAGYAFLIAALPRSADPILLAVISSIMVLGSLFVLSVAFLSAQTVSDVARLAELERDVIIDPLTGIHNRRFFNDRLAEEEARFDRTGAPLSLIIVDLDHFKSINDRFGHAAGDRVLIVTAARLTEIVRAFDVLARIGGEEFVILAPNTNAAEAEHLAERIRLAIRESTITLPGYGEVSITASFGVATHLPGERAQSLLSRADSALYAAKASGRNCVALAE